MRGSSLYVRGLISTLLTGYSSAGDGKASESQRRVLSICLSQYPYQLLSSVTPEGALSRAFSLSAVTTIKRWTLHLNQRHQSYR